MDNKVITHYDSVLYSSLAKEYTCNSGFANFGFWDKHITDSKQASCNLVERLLDLIPEKSGKILDVACGKGGTTNYLLNYYKPSNVTAINVSEKQLNSAGKIAPGCSFILMDATVLEFKNNSFDNIICVEGAFHFNTREKFFREAYRVLKPGGRLVLSDVLMKEGTEKQLRTFHEENFVRDLKSYESLCSKAGFEAVEIIDATKPCWEGHYWNIIRYIHEKYLSGDVDIETLKTFLDKVYIISASLKWYLLAGMTKPRS